MSTSSQNGTTFPFISAKDWKFTFWRKCTRQVSDWRTGRTAEGELKSKEWKAGGLTEGFKYWRVKAPRPLCCHDISTPDSQAYASPKMWGGKLCYSLDTLIVSMKRPQMYWHFRDPTWSLYDFASLKVTFLFIVHVAHYISFDTFYWHISISYKIISLSEIRCMFHVLITFSIPSPSSWQPLAISSNLHKFSLLQNIIYLHSFNE